MGQRSSSPQYQLDGIAILRRFSDEKMEETIALQNLQFIRRRAIELAQRREQFAWEVMAAGTMTALLLFAGSIYKRKDFVIPIAPLIMSVGYRYDGAYGTQPDIIRDSAEALLREDSTRFQPIGGPITLAQVDAFRKQMH